VISDSMLGTQVGDYRVIELIGSGSTGWVYAARHVKTERPAAIKLLRLEFAAHESIVARFLKEAKAINAVGHPNIVQVFDSGMVGKQHYIVLELLVGETLETRIERDKRLDVKLALPIFLQVADALAAAHDRKIVHRDIKPENIFLAQLPDKGETVKVLDFGIAKLLTSELNSERQLTEQGTILGTPQYMSPEQCLSDQTLDQRSDIYSLGLVLYRMVTGELPYLITNHHFMRYVLAHTQEPPRSPRSLVPELPLALEAVLLRALAKKPEQRYPDMRSMARALAPLRGAKETLTLVSATVDEKLAEELAPNPTQPRRAAIAIARFVLEGIYAGTLQLPTLPTAALRCIDLLRSPKYTVAGLVEALSRDPLLTSQVVGRANTAIMPGAAPARTLEQAIARIGTRPLGSLLIEISTRRVFECGNASIRRAFQQLWDHSIAVAMVAQSLARRLHADADLSYLAGLLHDVGKPVVGAILLEAERVAVTKRGAWHSRDTWLELISVCHREVGFALARAWQLPDEVLFAIARSDRYSADATPSPVNLVCLANALVKREGSYPRAVQEAEVAPIIDEGASLFGLSATDLDNVLGSYRAYVTQQASAEAGASG
jgi:putative nucleotidyltransferase with HDIG domain